MPDQTRVVLLGPRVRTVRTLDGAVLEVPEGWVLLGPGDAGVTRRVKASGPTWTVQERRGRKIFSRGVWALGSVVEAVKAQLEAERARPEYAKRRERDARRRAEEQAQYVGEFERAVLEFLAFDARHAELAKKLARAVTRHATPVGSGTVARTERIPIEERARAAVIAWMRHRTTGYDTMVVARVRGRRREVRRRLAGESIALLDAYRAGREVDGGCVLMKALSGSADEP